MTEQTDQFPDFDIIFNNLKTTLNRWKFARHLIEEALILLPFILALIMTVLPPQSMASTILPWLVLVSAVGSHRLVVRYFFPLEYEDYPGESSKEFLKAYMVLHHSLPSLAYPLIHILMTVVIAYSPDLPGKAMVIVATTLLTPFLALRIDYYLWYYYGLDKRADSSPTENPKP